MSKKTACIACASWLWQIEARSQLHSYFCIQCSRARCAAKAFKSHLKVHMRTPAAQILSRRHSLPKDCTVLVLRRNELMSFKSCDFSRSSLQQYIMYIIKELTCKVLHVYHVNFCSQRNAEVGDLMVARHCALPSTHPFCVGYRL